MKKSKEIIKTTGELLEHFLPWLIGLVVFGLGLLILSEGLKEIDGLELEITEGSLVMLFAFSFLYWLLASWAAENSSKVNNEDEPSSILGEKTFKRKAAKILTAEDEGITQKRLISIGHLLWGEYERTLEKEGKLIPSGAFPAFLDSYNTTEDEDAADK